MKWFGWNRGLVDPLTIAILLAHPIAALAVLAWFVRQHRWRRDSIALRGDERAAGVEAHQRDGHRLYLLAWTVVGFAFASSIAQTARRGDSWTAALPSTLHGATGLLGMALLTALWIWGRRTRDLREAGESFAVEKRRHGRASDFILALAALHAFLGFLDLLAEFA